MNIQLQFYDSLQTGTSRCLNNIKVFFPLKGEIECYRNGQAQVSTYEPIIINHGDIYSIAYAHDIVELTLPLSYMLSVYPTFMNAYLDESLLKNHDYLKHLVLKILTGQQDQIMTNKRYLEEIVSILKKETLVHCESNYLPRVITDHSVLNQIIKYVDSHLDENMTASEISNQFYVSISYISILFKRYLNISYKEYYASLKIALSLPDLLTKTESTTTIARNWGYTNLAIYTRHFKDWLHFTPKLFRLHNQSNIEISFNIISNNFHHYHEDFHTLVQDTPVAYSQTTIHLDTQLNFETTHSFKTFIHVDRLSDLLNQSMIDDDHLDLSTLFNPYIVINETEDLIYSGSACNITIKYLDTLLNKGTGFVITLHSQYEMASIEKLVTQFFTYKPHYHHFQQVKLMLLFDTTALHFNTILSYLRKMKTRFPNIQFAVTMEGIIHTEKELLRAFDKLKRLECDHYFISIDHSETINLLTEKSKAFNQNTNNIEHLTTLSERSGIPAHQIVHAHLSKLKFLDKETQSKARLADILSYLIKLLQQGISIGFKLNSQTKDDVALLSAHGIRKPISHVYQFLKPFINKKVNINPNYLLTRQGTTVHLLLFNALNQPLKNNNIQSFVLSSIEQPEHFRFTQTLNRQHGLIDYALPKQFQHALMDEEILRYMRLSNIPKAELAHCQLTNNEESIITLQEDELKYIRVLPADEHEMSLTTP
ncbi:AraC family transcriptional regulator Rsp [Staphylococcus sp. SQ8-PEA]|uniref:AraC family transcriptional regulator Rsp n=1 Tax=Staphylococcus marylandisciuri TaxID=2981529 RepID=A0ABT2QMS2_9STAP|nr:AraC family transcriptional regulator Rsp [Staphylococcus marylandisciuri]MCU5745279.1 AraC family transcriptional regulator Rsp [Staphylococcus marylandisciuri]